MKWQIGKRKGSESADPNRPVALSQRARRRKWRTWRDALLLVAPFTILYIVLFLYPSGRVLQLSFTSAGLAGGGEYVGFANYERLLQDPLFWTSFRNTWYFVLLTVVPNTALGLIFALMVVRLTRLKSIVLAMFFLPYILPVSVVTLTWQWIMDRNFGIFNQIFGTSLAVFGNPIWAMPTVAFVTIWWTVGFNMLLFIAGLQGISKEYYEAASIDGANSLQIFRNVTWPLLWPITALVLTLQLIAQLKIFDQIYLLTGGGPFNSTVVLLMHVYREGFQRFNGGYASAISVILFIVILVASLVQYRFLRTGAAR
jgi:multiple sugar transport system permease protein